MPKQGLTSRTVMGAMKYSNIVSLFLALLIGMGVYGLMTMNKDEFPTFEIKQGLIAVAYPGADVQQMVQQVAKPMEKKLFSMQEIIRESTRVVCKDGMCYIYVDVNVPASKKTETWSKIRLELDSYKSQLPPGVLAIVVMDDFSDLTSVLIALESEDKGYDELQDYADRLSSMLEEIPQLASVKMLGSQSEEIAVTVDMERLAAYGISPSALMLEYAGADLQLLGGSLSTGYGGSPVHMQKSIGSEKELGEKVIYTSREGESLRLKDIATIERRFKDPSALVSFNGNNALVLSISMRPDNNIVSFGKEVDKVLAAFQQQLPDSVTITRITDQPQVVGHSVWSFLRDLLISMLVVILVMILLFPIKSALIASSGVPVCTAVALALMYLCGITLNTVSLAALIVVLGMIVDDSIITMDGYMDKLGRGLPRIEAACGSAQELFPPMFMATVAISAMFFPMLGIISGYLGDFIQTFPWVITFALMASLAYAILVVPSLETRFIHSSRQQKETIISRFQNTLFDFLNRTYEKMQNFCFKVPRLTIVMGVGIVALGLLMFSKTNIQLMPMANRPLFAVEIYLPPESSLEQTRAVADSLSRMLRSDERISSVTEFIGSGTPRFHATYNPILPGPNVAQLVVNTTSNKATGACLREMEDKYEHYFTNAKIRFKQMDYQGVACPVEVKVVGEDYDAVRSVADSLKAYMSGLDMLKWVHSDTDNLLAGISLDMDEDQAAQLGVNRAMMNVFLSGSLAGTPIASLREDGKELPVTLYSQSLSGEPDYETLANTLVPSSVPSLMVPLRQVATMRPDWNPEQICRCGGEQVIYVGADMKYGMSQPLATRAIKKYLKTASLPEGVRVELGGLNSVNRSVGPEIALSFLAAVFILFVFLLFHFKKISLSILTIVLSSLCLFGAFFGLWIFDLDFSMTAVLGLVSLVGIIVRNGIIMFEYAEELHYQKDYSIEEAAREAGKRRMRPIFLTSCTTALGVLPMIISGDLLWMPMGVVICFGTLLSIFPITLIMPIAYWQIFKRKK